MTRNISISTFILTASLLLFHCNRPYCGPPNSKKGPADTTINTVCKPNLYLKFEGNFADSSGYNNSVILHGVPTINQGKYGWGMQLVGSNAYLEIPHTFRFDGKSIAVMAWLFPVGFDTFTNGIATSAAYSGFFNKWDNNTRSGISTYCTQIQSRVNGYFANSGFYDFGSVKGNFLKPYLWQHVAYVIRKTGVIELYLNGVIVATSSTGNTSGMLLVNTPIEIGRTKWYPSNLLMLSYFRGRMDEVKVFYNCPDIDISKQM